MGQRGACDRQRLTRLNGARQCRRSFRIGARCLRAGTELIVGKRTRCLRDRLSPLHVGLSRSDSLLRRNRIQKCERHCMLDSESRHAFVGVSAVQRGFCLVHSRSA